MIPVKTLRRATAVLIAAGALAPTLAGAGTLAHRAPPSDYLLPEPVSREPTLDDLVNGNGKLHFSGAWRHWGDSRNSGELVQMLLAPNQVLSRNHTANGLPSSRFCYDNPDRC